MRIFIFLLLFLVISGCQGNKDMRADLNLALLTIDSEEDFRALPILIGFKNKAESFEFEVDVPSNLIAKRFKHCWSDGQLLRMSQSSIENESQFTTYKNSSFITAYNPFSGYFITDGWEIDSLSNKASLVKVYSNWLKLERYLGFAKGISEEDSITYNACKF